MTKRTAGKAAGMVLLVITVIVFMILLLAFLIKDKTPEVPDTPAQGSQEISDVISHDEVNTPVKESDPEAIDASGLAEVLEEKLAERKKQEEEATADTSGLKEGTKEYVGASEGVKILRPGISFSFGALAEDNLDTFIAAAEYLYEQKLKEEGRDVLVEMDRPRAEELEEFIEPVLYIVEDGVLFLNVRATIYDLERELKQEVLLPIAIQYDGAVLKLAEGGD